MTGWRLVADVGGTNVRFARAPEGGRLVDRVERRVANYPSFTHALRAYLEGIDTPAPCEAAAIAAAGPVCGDEIKLTNLDWTIRRGAVSKALNGAPVSLFNDLQAAALSVPHLEDTDLVPILTVATARDPSAPRLAINIGTGFGAATLVCVDGRWASFPSEAGHMTFTATTPDEFRLLSVTEPGFRSFEDALSGPGLMNLYARYSSPNENTAIRGPSPSRILERAATDYAARRATETFTALLARVCGDLVLASAAWGGVYLFGSVALGWHEHGALHVFGDIFRAKAKMASRMAAVPVHIVRNDIAPLIGLARQ